MEIADITFWVTLYYVYQPAAHRSTSKPDLLNDLDQGSDRSLIKNRSNILVLFLHMEKYVGGSG